MNAWLSPQVRKYISIFLIVSTTVVSIFSPNRPVYAASSTLITDKINEASPLPQNTFGYQEFRTFQITYSYSGSASVCLSKTSDVCDPVQVDDGIKVWVNATQIGDYQSKTQPVSIVIPANRFVVGNNLIKVVLYDMQGPFRGTSPIYLVTGGTSPWYNNCQTQVLGGDLFTGEGYLIQLPTLHVRAKYQYSIEGCNSFLMLRSSESSRADEFGKKSFGFDVKGTVNNTEYSLSFDDKGGIKSASSAWSPNKSNHRVRLVTGSSSDYWVELGVEDEYQFGSTATGMKGVQTLQLVAGQRKITLPPALRFVVDVGLIKEQSTIASSAIIVGAFAAIYKSLPALAPYWQEVAPALQQFWLSVQAVPLPLLSAKEELTDQVAREETRWEILAVAPDVQAAVSQRLGSLTNFTTLNTITSRDRISAYTIFDFTAGGFTPNSPVYVTFGLPSVPDDFYVLLLKSDASGNIKSTIKMPTKSEVSLGKYLLMALDYKSLESSLNAVFADPTNGVLSVKGAAKLIDVVEDVMPPVTTAFVTGPLDVNRVFKDTVTVSFTATDDLSGIDYTQYSLNGGTTWISIPTTGTFQISGNGITSFLYRSVDKYGNVEGVKNSGPIAISKYVIFASDPSTSLTFQSNTSMAITGTVHTNGNANISFNTLVQLYGTLETTLSGSQLMYNTATNIPMTMGPNLPMLSYPMASYQNMATTVYPSSVTFASTAQTLSGIYYVNGDVTLQSATLTGDVTIVATGTIFDQSTSTSIVSSDPNNGITLYAGRDIYLRGTTVKAVGMIYAPQGTVYLSAVTSVNINGSLVGKSVVVKNSNKINLKYAAGFPASTYQLPITAAQEPRAISSLSPAPMEEPLTNTIYLPLVTQ